MQLLLLLLLFLSSTILLINATSSITIHQPVDGSRVINQEPLVIEYSVQGFDMPKDGYLRVYGNKKDLGVALTQQSAKLQVSHLAEGIHAVEIAMFKANGVLAGVNATTHFIKRTLAAEKKYSKFSKHAESPILDGTMNLNKWPEDWQFSNETDTKMNKLVNNRLKRWSSEMTDDTLAFLQSYVDFHNKAMTSLEGATFLIFRSADVGLGNKIQSLVSAFLLAVAMRRVFLVDSALIHHMLAPPSFQWHYSTVVDRLGIEFIENSSSELVDLTWENPQGFSWILCADYDLHFNNSKFIFLFSDQYFAPAVVKNPHYAPQLKNIFGSDVFGILSRFLLTPRDFVLREVASFYANHLRGHELSVGVQVRTATMSGFDAPFMAWDSFAWNDMPVAFLKCAKIAAEEKNAVFFLATDHPRLREIFTKSFKQGNFVWKDNVISRTGVAGHVDALIDILLLALCDANVVTSMSTFGYVSSGWSSKVPFVVTYQGHCLREVTSQPCFHKWNYLFDSECYNREDMSLSLDVRYCGPLSPAQQQMEPLW